MGFVLMTDPVTGNVAVFEENGTTGSASDPNSTRNAPLNSPGSHLSKIRFHVSFDYYLLHSGPTSVSVTHPSVAGASTAYPSAGLNAITRLGQAVTTNTLLVSHSLGYVPAYMVASGGTLIGPSSVIQENPTAAGGRIVTPYATTTGIYISDTGYSGSTALPSLGKTYQVIVFRAPIEDSSYLIDYDPSTGQTILGRGKFKGSLKALRVASSADASPFDIPLGRTVDIRNGVPRTVLADGSTFTYPGYTGSFTGSPSIQGTVE